MFSFSIQLLFNLNLISWLQWFGKWKETKSRGLVLKKHASSKYTINKIVIDINLSQSMTGKSNKCQGYDAHQCASHNIRWYWPFTVPRTKTLTHFCVGNPKPKAWWHCLERPDHRRQLWSDQMSWNILSRYLLSPPKNLVLGHSQNDTDWFTVGFRKWPLQIRFSGTLEQCLHQILNCHSFSHPNLSRNCQD